MFNTFYALDSMCFFFVDGKIKIIWSTDGSRMGCVLGSFGFDLTVEDIYEAVDEKYPELKKKALTDVFTIGVPPPESPEETQNTWELCGEVFRFIADESMKVAGLSLNFSKCHALAPAAIGDPNLKNAEDLLTLPKGTSLEREGIRLAGAPIGTDNFCRKYIIVQVRDATSKMKALEGIDPQTGFNLL